MSSLTDIKNMYSNGTKEFNKMTMKESETPANEQLAVKVSLINTYLGWTAFVAKLDPDVLEANSMIVFEKTPDEEKILSMDVLSYLASNFGLLILALSDDFIHIRDVMADFIEQEIELDELNSDERKAKRKAMQLKSKEPIPKESGTINLAKHELSYDITMKLITAVNQSYLKYIDTNVDTEYQRVIGQFQDDDFVIMGYILSNYFYILRALNHNPKCLVTIVDVLNRYKEYLNI